MFLCQFLKLPLALLSIYLSILDVIANALDYSFEVSEFELQLRY